MQKNRFTQEFIQGQREACLIAELEALQEVINGWRTISCTWCGLTMPYKPGNHDEVEAAMNQHALECEADPRTQEIQQLKKDNERYLARIDELTRQCNEIYAREEEVTLVLSSVERAAAAVQEMLEESQAEVKRLRDANRWIPVSERLPVITGEWGQFLVAGEEFEWHFPGNEEGPTTVKKPVVWACFFSNEEGFHSSIEVTHWRPLPEPPQNEQDARVSPQEGSTDSKGDVTDKLTLIDWNESKKAVNDDDEDWNEFEEDGYESLYCPHCGRDYLDFSVHGCPYCAPFMKGGEG
jgi:hypothetical protein